MIEIQKLFQQPDYYRDLIALSLDALKEKYDRAASPADIIFTAICTRRRSASAWTTTI